MNKYITTSIISVFLITAATHADNSKLMMKSGIGLNDGSYSQQNQDQNSDPVKWKDDTRLSKNPPKAEAKTDESKCFYVTSPVTNIRSTPSFLGDRIGIYKYGNYICEKSRNGDWINTGTGWVNIKFLSDKSPDTRTSANPTETKAQTTVKPVAIKRQPQAPKPAASAPAVPSPTAQAEQPMTQSPKKKLLADKQMEKQMDAKSADLKQKDKQMQDKDKKDMSSTYINGDNVNIRRKPDKNSKIVGTYKVNQKVKVIATKGEWSKTKKGWVNSKFISTSNDDNGDKNSKGKDKQAAKDKIIKCLTVSNKKVNIRSTPAKRSKDIGDYDKGANVCFSELKGNWGRTDKGWVNLANFKEQKCYTVLSDNLKVMSKPSSSSKVVKTLKKGDQVCESSKKYGWINNGKGWVSSVFLK